MNLTRFKLTRTAAVVLFALLTSALFFLDISTPSGVADGIGYAPVLVLCLWIGGRRAILSGAVLLSGLTLIGQAFTGPGGIGHLDIVNRAIGLVSIWVMAAILIHRAQVEREIAASAEKARQEAEEKQQLLEAMNHALRTPLNAIVGFSEVLATNSSLMADPSAAESLTAVHTSALQLLEQVNDFLDFSKLEAGQIQVNFEPMDIDPVVADAVSLAQFLAKQAGIELAVKIPTGLPPVMADARLAMQGIVNVLSNAIKFTGRGGRIDIAAAIAGDRLKLTIADTGPGIAAEDLSRLGRPFVQLRQPGNYSRPGTGLGLSLTKTFMELQRGSLGLESELGKGTTVSFFFPFAANSKT